MRILKIDESHGFLEVIPETLDDLWHLERIIDAKDVISAKTTRKIKGEEGKDTERITMYLDLEVEKSSFEKFNEALKVQGIIIGGKPEEYIELKSHHSISIGLGDIAKIHKKTIKKYQIERLEKAQKATHAQKLLAVCLDDDFAEFFVIKEFGIDRKGVINSGKSGKRFEEEDWRKGYFAEIAKKLIESNQNNVLIAGPGFTKDDLYKYLQDKKLKSKIFIESCGNAGSAGLNELLKSNKLQKAIKENEIIKEAQLMERVLLELGKNSGLVVYGESEIENALNARAIEELLLLDSLLVDKRNLAERILDLAEKQRAKVHIFSNENDAGKKLEGFGGIIAILRYKMY